MRLVRLNQLEAELSRGAHGEFVTRDDGAQGHLMLGQQVADGGEPGLTSGVGYVVARMIRLDEILPWDFWPGFGPELNTAGESEWVFWDHVAELTLQADAHFEELRDFYQTTPRLHVPAEWLE